MTIRLRALFCAILIVVSAATFSGCGGSGSDDNGDGGLPITPGRVVEQPGWTLNNNQPTTVQARKKWTILVYMNGANNLEPYGSLNINQMETVGSDSASLNIVCQFKRIANRYDYGNGDWSGTRRMYVTRDNNRDVINSTVLSSKQDCDMGRAQTLREFVDWGVTAFPAERYAIVLWNHGAGWRSQKIRSTSASGVPTRGFSYDDVTGSNINTIEFRNVLDKSVPWDLIVWDSSLMQIAEVAHELKDISRYIVGSCESPPGFGYPYDLFLSRLAENPSMDARTFGTFIVQDTIAAYNNSTYLNSWDMSSERGITQSILDSSKVAGVTAAANQLGAALLAAQARYGTQIAAARADTEGSYSGAEYTANKDIRHFCSLLQATVPDSGVQAAITQMRAACDAAILTYVNGPDHPETKGLYMFIPSPSQYRTIDRIQADGFGQRYQELQFAKDAPNWQSFLVQGPP